MNTVARLALYGSGLVLVFGLAFVAGRALVPEETVATWTREAEKSAAEHEGMEQSGDHDASSGLSHVTGLSMEQDGFRLGPVDGPQVAGVPATLSFRIFGPDGKPFTGYAVNHEKQLHLILVRSDGADFQHVHPRLDRRTGTWSVPSVKAQGGTYRVYADFLPERPDSRAITLSRNMEVAGAFEPVNLPLSRTDSVDGFEVSISGELKAGERGDLTVRVTRDGRPETHLERYLGAFGHLVALRDGDLAYLHVHAEEGHDRAKPGGGGHSHGNDLAGPEIGFEAEAPTPGRYLLYLDFKVAGEVHTAEFVMEAK